MYPIISLSITGLLTLFLGFLDNKRLVFPASLFFLGIALGLSFVDWNAPGVYFHGMLEVNNTGIAFWSLILGVTILIMALSDNFEKIEFAHPAEYFAIVQFALVGAIMMVSYKNLIMLFLGIEILSVALYVLTGSDKRNIRGNEAAIKYFLMGAFATGILLFGVAMYYGGAGTFEVNLPNNLLSNNTFQPIFFLIGCLFILVGMLFKVAAAPFHFWTPDVYEGAPTIFTAFMATVVKIAGFMALYKVLSMAFGVLSTQWTLMFSILVALSMVLGNLGAFRQDNFKRVMAFSSISHAGFMLMALLGDPAKSSEVIFFYSAAYALATVAAFGVLMLLSSEKTLNGRPFEQVAIFSGLFKNNPILAGVLIIAMLSLAGIPLTGGFWAKFMVFKGAIEAYTWLVVIAVLMSAVAIYYYFRPIILSLKGEPAVGHIKINTTNSIIFIITTIGTILLGLLPNIVQYVLK